MKKQPKLGYPDVKLDFACMRQLAVHKCSLFVYTTISVGINGLQFVGPPV